MVLMPGHVASVVAVRAWVYSDHDQNVIITGC
jgi:hypothetical protein